MNNTKFTESYKHKILEVAEEKLNNNQVESLNKFVENLEDYKEEIVPNSELIDVSYSSVYRWAKKYNSSIIGEGVAETTGRPKEKEETSKEETSKEKDTKENNSNEKEEEKEKEQEGDNVEIDKKIETVGRIKSKNPNSKHKQNKKSKNLPAKNKNYIKYVILGVGLISAGIISYKSINSKKESKEVINNGTRTTRNESETGFAGIKDLK